MFGLINKVQLMSVLSHYVMVINKREKIFKTRFNNKEITEWEYYKMHWELKGRFHMIEDFFEKLQEMG